MAFQKILGFGTGSNLASTWQTVFSTNAQTNNIQTTPMNGIESSKAFSTRPMTQLNTDVFQMGQDIRFGLGGMPHPKYGKTAAITAFKTAKKVLTTKKGK